MTKKEYKCSKCGKKITKLESSAYDRMCYGCWRARGGMF